METSLFSIGYLARLSKLLLLVIICVELSRSTLLLIKSVRSTKWPKTAAKIIISGVDVEYDSDGDTHKPCVEYTYIVADTEYVSDCCAFCSYKMTFRTISKSAVKKFPRGSVALVAYNPDNPGESVLLTGITRLHIPQLIYMSFLLFIIFKFWL